MPKARVCDHLHAGSGTRVYGRWTEVAHDVEPAHFGDCGGDEGVHVGLAGDVADDGEAAAALRADVCHQRVQLLFSGGEIVEDDVEAVVCEAQGDGPSDALCGSGNDCHFVRHSC